jgi:Cu/Ag efflux pump CusA
MLIGLSSKDVSLIDMSVLARWTIVPKLLGVPGVANVAVWGLRSRQLQVQVDPNRLQAAGVTLDQIVETAGDALWVSPLSFLEASTPGTGGWIDTPNQRLAIQHIQPIVSPTELAEVAVAEASVSLGDVAKVVEEHPPLIGDAIINDGPGLLLVVERFRDSDARAVVRGVDAALHELRQGMPGIDVDASLFRSTDFIDAALRNFGIAMAIGGGLVVVVLGAFLSWRAALVGIAAVLASLATAGLILSLRQAPIDTMALAGLTAALAAIVAEVVTQLDAIMRRLAEHRHPAGGRSVAVIVLNACSDIRGPVAYAIFIVILALAPVLLIGGSAGEFLSPLVVTYLIALLASSAVAVTLTPVLSLMVLGNAKDAPDEATRPWRLRQRYDEGLARVLGAPLPVFVAAGLLTLAAFAAIPVMNWSLLPDFQERDLRISWRASPGTSLPEMSRVLTNVSKELRSLPGIRQVAAHVGRAITGDQVVGVEAGQIWVGIDPDADYGATVASIREAVLGYPGFTGEVQTYLTERVNEILGGAADPVVVRIEGPQRAGLRSEAERVAEILADIPGIADLQVDAQIDMPHVEIRVDVAAAGRVGLKPGDVRRAAATIFAGIEVGNLYEQQKVFEVVVWGAPETRRSLTDLRELLIDTPNGGHVRLADVAEVLVQPTPQGIVREGITQHIDIHAGVAGRHLGDVSADIRKTLSAMEFPLEYHAVLLGDYADRQAEQLRIGIAALVAAMAIFFVLQACFQSWRVAALFYLTLPVALSGGVLAVAAMGGTVLLGSLFGLLAVLGLAAQHGLLLVKAWQESEQHSAESRPQLVRRAALERAGSLVASATAVAAVFLPVLAMGRVEGLEIIHPTAVVIVAGLITATAVNLFLLPALYLRVAGAKTEIQEYGSEQYVAS